MRLRQVLSRQVERHGAEGARPLVIPPLVRLLRFCRYGFQLGSQYRERAARTAGGGYLRGRCDHLCAGVDVRHGGTKELVHHKLVDECDALADGSCERVEPGFEAGEQGRTCLAFEGATSAAGAWGSKEQQDEICSEQSCSSGSHGRYQTAFLFAERPYSPAEGEVGKIGGGPDDQFWRDRGRNSQPAPSAPDQVEATFRDQAHQTKPTSAGADVRISPDSELRVAMDRLAGHDHDAAVHSES